MGSAGAGDGPVPDVGHDHRWAADRAAGAHVTLVLASATRDGELREGAACWDPTAARAEVQGLVFGAGRHACLGWAIALQELDAFFTGLLGRFDLEGTATAGKRGPNIVFGRFDVAVTLTPRPRVGQGG